MCIYIYIYTVYMHSFDQGWSKTLQDSGPPGPGLRSIYESLKNQKMALK